MIILKALQWPYKTIIQHHAALDPHFLWGHLNIISRSVSGPTIRHITSHHMGHHRIILETQPDQSLPPLSRADRTSQEYLQTEHISANTFSLDNSKYSLRRSCPPALHCTGNILSFIFSLSYVIKVYKQRAGYFILKVKPPLFIIQQIWKFILKWKLNLIS